MPDQWFHSPTLSSGTLGDLHFALVQEVESDGYAGGVICGQQIVRSGH